MKKQTKQLGFAHIVIIIVILAVVLIGALGFLFFKNYSKDGSDVAKVLNSYKKYTTDSPVISFEYPSNWSVIENEDGVVVSNEDGQYIATLDFESSMSSCSDNKFTIIKSVDTPIVSSKPVSVVAYGSKATFYDGFELVYELNYENPMENSTTYECISPSVPLTIGGDEQAISFGIGDFSQERYFVNKSAAEKYVESVEYKKIERMLGSITF